MEVITIYEYFKEGGKIKPGHSLYRHISKKDISTGSLLGYLDRNKGIFIDQLAQIKNIQEDAIFDFIDTYLRHKKYEQMLNERGYEF